MALNGIFHNHVLQQPVGLPVAPLFPAQQIFAAPWNMQLPQVNQRLPKTTETTIQMLPRITA